MLGFRGPAQQSPTLGDALNAGYLYLEVRWLGCDTHQTVALDVVGRAKATPIHELLHLSAENPKVALPVGLAISRG
jgi:hypothetical protein